MATVPAVAVKFAVVAPAVTITDAGAVSAALLEDSPTEAPPVSAADVKVTVQVEVAPDDTEFGAHDKLETEGGAGGITVTEAVVLPFMVAVTVTVWLLATVPAVAMKLAVIAPAATVAEAGTVSAALFEESPTDALPLGARVIVTVQLDAAPEATELGTHDKLETAGAGGVTVTEAVALPFSVAVTVTV